LRILEPILLAVVLLIPAYAGSPNQDPFHAPPDMSIYMQNVVFSKRGAQEQMQAIITAIFMPVDQGGLGITYDNQRTRTVEEVWSERKANCLSLTAFYVAAANSTGFVAKYAEALNTNHWRRNGGIVRFERHVVALVQVPLMNDDMVADFLPQLRRRFGTYVVKVLPPPTFRALYYSNRAVEFMDAGDMDSAMAMADKSVQTDPNLGTGWNTRGVMLQLLGNSTEAESCFKKTLKLEPNDSAAIGNMEGLMRSQNRLKEATFYRNRGLEVRKKDPYFQAFLAEEALIQDHPDDAAIYLKSAIKLNPYEPEFYLLQARLEIIKGQLDGAAKAIEKAQKLATPAERERYDNKLDAIRRRQGIQMEKPAVAP
jgi:tetratricopeptide (TPR) repeat protein